MRWKKASHYYFESQWKRYIVGLRVLFTKKINRVPAVRWSGRNRTGHYCSWEVCRVLGEQMRNTFFKLLRQLRIVNLFADVRNQNVPWRPEYLTGQYWSLEGLTKTLGVKWSSLLNTRDGRGGWGPSPNGKRPAKRYDLRRQNYKDRPWGVGTLSANLTAYA